MGMQNRRKNKNSVRISKTALDHELVKLKNMEDELFC